MKNIKRLLAIAILTIISVPAVVNAYSVHKVGEYVNFYVSNDEKAAKTELGVAGISLDKADASDKDTIKTLLFGATSPKQIIDSNRTGYLDLEQNLIAIASTIKTEKDGVTYNVDLDQMTDRSKGIALPSKQDMMDLFGVDAASCTDGCRVDITEHVGEYKFFGWVMKDMLNSNVDANLNSTIKYLALADTEGTNMWVLELDYTDNGHGYDWNGATIKKVANSEAVNVGGGVKRTLFMPVVYMRKDMECHEQEFKSMCYDCSGSYKWLMEGSSEAAACTALPDKTSEAECKNEACYDCNGEYKWFAVGQQGAECELIKSIDVKSKCARPPKTGVEDYILEFLIIVSVAALVLFVVRKNDLFKTI